MVDMSEDISNKLPEGLDEDEYSDLIEEMYEEDPLARDLMDAVAKRHWIGHDVFDGDLESAYELFKSLLLMSFVSNAELEYYLSTEKGKQVFEQVKKDFEREEVSDDLQELHRQNAAPVLQEIDSLIEEIRRDLFGDSYEEISALEESDREDREEILERIRDPILYDSANEEEVDNLLVLQNTRKKVANFPYSEEDTKSEQVKVKEDEYRIHKHYALQILKPRLYTLLYRFEDEFRSFPLRWLNTSKMRLLYYEYKDGTSMNHLLSRK